MEFVEGRNRVDEKRKRGRLSGPGQEAKETEKTEDRRERRRGLRAQSWAIGGPAIPRRGARWGEFA